MTFHEARINAHGWSGYGYIIVDPETGAGAYLIEGNGNGGYLLGVLNGFGFVALITAWTFGMVGFLTLALAVLLVVSVIATAIAIYLSENSYDVAACYNTGLSHGAGLYGILYSLLSSRIGNNGKKSEFFKTLADMIASAVYMGYKPEGAPAMGCIF